MSSDNTFNVAVTGNRPFMEYEYNTSAMVKDALPHIINKESGSDIRIWKYHRNTWDTYEDVRQVSKDIWSGDRSFFLPSPATGQEKTPLRVDLVLHLGMVALGWDPHQFRFETKARRDGYKLSGDDGKFVDSAELEKLGLPPTLSTSLDIEAAWREVKIKFPDSPIFVSDNAGLYFCEFRLYSSLAEPLLDKTCNKKKGRTVFEHLPQDHTPEAISLARDITVALISSLADDPFVKDA